MKILVCLLGATLFITGCEAQPVPQPAPKSTVKWTKDVATEIEIEEAKKTVIGQLKDPESARFGEIWATNGTNGNRIFCGYINAKNSYGGYTGNKIFAILRPGRVAIQGSDSISSYLPEICLPQENQ